MKISILLILWVGWMFLPSTYSHKDGERVNQYKPIPPVYVEQQPVRRRIWRHRRSDMWFRNSHDLYREWEYYEKP